MSSQTSTEAVDASTENGAICPFSIDVSDEQLADLRRRITATNWRTELFSNELRAAPR